MKAQPLEKIRSYRDLRVWQKAVDLVVVCYQLAKRLPPDERFGLVTQIQRAAVSVPANIAEGYARRTRGDYIHHLAIAAGSLAELETHWIVVVRLGHLRQEELRPFTGGAGELGKMLEVLIQKLKAKKPWVGPRSLVPGPCSLDFVLHRSKVASQL